MSWKIYNGFKMKYLSMQEFFHFTQELKERINDMSKEKYFEYIVNFTLSMKNKLCLLNAEYKKTKDGKEIENYLKKIFYTSFVPNSNILSDVILAGKKYEFSYDEIYFKLTTHFSEIFELNHNKINNIALFGEISQRRLPFDFSSSLCIYPIEDENGKNSKILLLPYGLTNELFNILLESKDEKDIAFVNKYELKSYYYQNSTDDTNVSKEEYKQRESDWKFVFSKSSIPCEACMTIFLNDIDNFFTSVYLLSLQMDNSNNLFSKYIENIDFEKMCRNMAIEKVQNDYVKKQKEIIGEKFSIYYTIEEFKKKLNNQDEEIENLISIEESYYKNVLSPFTLEDFHNTPIDYLVDYNKDFKLDYEFIKKQMKG